MSQSLALVLVHIIFSTKIECHSECDPLQVGGVEDDVHILCGLSTEEHC
jgi:hypothetical protein